MARDPRCGSTRPRRHRFRHEQARRARGARGHARCARWEPGSGIVVQRIESSIGQRRGRADFEALRFGLFAWPGRLERTAASGRPPAAPQRGCGDDRDLRAPGDLQCNVDSPVGVAPTEERRAVDRVDDPDPIGLTASTELLTDERIFRPRRRQRLAKQSLDFPVGFRDWCAVRLRRCRDAGLEVSEREVPRPVRHVERKLQVVSADHDRRRYRAPALAMRACVQARVPALARRAT